MLRLPNSHMSWASMAYSNRSSLLVWICTNPSITNHTLMNLWQSATHKKIKLLFCATVCSLLMGHLGLKHGRIDVLKHYCNFDELCTFFGLRYGNGSIKLWSVTGNTDLIKLLFFNMFQNKLWIFAVNYF